ncbi:MAG: AMP-binding protein [Gemmatimonadetes bacterium]|nr:AMP-binding protein [Gemmatimonadota bacterium]MBK9069166.1 AMP-binding protein [Gemmatimonadota bacterium]MBK9692932.1 AMP-binding protein [Gemmatimonadota bacterium]
MNLAELLWVRAEQSGDRPAILAPGSATSWLGLRRRASAWAAALARAGLVPGDRVAILCPRGPEAIAAYFGVLAAGGIAVQLDLAFRDAQIKHILRHSGARIVVADPGCLPQGIPHAELTLLRSTDLTRVGGRTPIARDADDPAQLIYTSGSTGLAKGVVVTHGNLVASARIVTEYLGIVPTDRIASVLTVSFVYGLSQVLLAVQAGATLVIIDAALPADVIDAFRRERITVLAAVPLLWHQWLATPGFREQPLPDLRVLTNAGGGISAETALAIVRAQPGARLFLMYGLTEALRSTFLPPEEVHRRAGSIGRAIAETEIFLVREDGAECGIDEVGEIVQAGPTVTLGYWDNPEATARAFVPHPRGASGRAVRTGDLARRDAAGFLYFVGRRDRQVKSLGYRVNPEELEHALTDSGLTGAHAVLALPDPMRGHALVAYVVLAPGVEVAAIRRYCGRELPRHLQPTTIRVLTELPRLPSGKPDLARLASL